MNWETMHRRIEIEELRRISDAETLTFANDRDARPRSGLLRRAFLQGRRNSTIERGKRLSQEGAQHDQAS
jgi:hypothetical protein